MSLTVGGNGQNASYTGVLSGSGSLIKIGGGLQSLAPSSTTTYRGNTTVSAGTLQLVDSVPAKAATVNIAPGAALTVYSDFSAPETAIARRTPARR